MDLFRGPKDQYIQFAEEAFQRKILGTEL